MSGPSLSDTEVMLLRQMRDAGMPVKEIARVTGRVRGTVSKYTAPKRIPGSVVQQRIERMDLRRRVEIEGMELRRLIEDLEARLEHAEHCMRELTTMPVDVPPGMTKGEARVVGALMAKPGMVFTRNQILAAKNYDRPGHYPVDRAVDVLVGKIKPKLAAAGLGRIEAVFGVGYRYVPEVQA